MSVFGRRLAYTSLALGASAAAGGTLLYRRHNRSKVPLDTKYYVNSGGTGLSGPIGGTSPYLPPSREAMISKMKQEKFDVLVIGGGASGGGVLVDASARGLKCCLVEAGDFASGTSSKSTKLIHGGIRYLQKAFEEFDFGQSHTSGQAQRHMPSSPTSSVSGILVSLMARGGEVATKVILVIQGRIRWSCGDFLWAARLGSHAGVPPTSYLPAATTRFALPLLPKQGLKGSLLYFDGQMNDSRLCLALCLTPTVAGFVDGMKEAAAANYVRVIELLKDENGKIIGVRAEDRETNEEFTIYAKVVVNCTGPLADLVRKMDHEDAAPVVLPAAGAHIVLPHWYSHFTPFGLLLPETSDGRVLFLLPWEGQTIAGTTDGPALGSQDPRAKSVDVDFLVQEMSAYLGVDPQQMRNDIQSVWCGHRPLVSQSREGKDTAGIVRSHTVLVDEKSGLVTLLGGKWTTYRRMAEDTVNTLLEAHKDKLAASSACRTREMKVQGAVDPLCRLEPQDCNFNSGRLVHELASSHPSLTFDQREHLIKTYGFLARDVAALGQQDGLLEPLVPGFPYLKAEVVYACRNEQARAICDVIARRIPLLFLNQKKGVQAIETVCSLMESELGWSAATSIKKKEEAIRFAETFTVGR
ncbi:hypothetical protein Efla_004007 [Eimeria flavescens]